MAWAAGRGNGCLYIIIYSDTQKSSPSQKNSNRDENREKGSQGGKEGAGTTPKACRGRAGANSGKMGLGSSHDPRTHPAASYAAAARPPLTSELQCG